MEITDILARTGGIASMARELGIDESQAASGAQALLPAILGGFKKQVQSQPGGLDALGGLLGQLGGGSLFDEVVGPQPTSVDRGNEVLGQIFGSRDVSRTVAQNAASQSGLDPAILKQMLPMLAMLVAGFLAKRQGVGDGGQAAAGGEPAQPASGGLGDALGGLLGGLLGGRGGAPASGSAAGALPGIGSMLDLNGDGNALDDILRMAGKLMR